MLYELQANWIRMYVPVTVKPTGRWKIVITEGEEDNPILHLEAVISGSSFMYPRKENETRWISESALSIKAVPEVKEYINECARC